MLPSLIAMLPSLIATLLAVVYVVGRDATQLTPVTALTLGGALAALMVALRIADLAPSLVPTRGADVSAIRLVGVATIVLGPLCLALSRWWEARSLLPSWTPGALAAAAVVAFFSAARIPWPSGVPRGRYAVGTVASGLLLFVAFFFAHDSIGTMLTVRPGTGLIHVGLFVGTWMLSCALLAPVATRYAHPVADAKPSRLEIVVATAVVLLGLALLEADRRLFVDLYIPLHLWLGLLGMLCIDTGGRYLLGGLSGRAPRIVGGAAGLALIAAAAIFVLRIDTIYKLRTRNQLSQTVAGSSLLQLFPPRALQSTGMASKNPGVGWEQYLDRRPELERPNLLLVSIDTLRADVLTDKGKPNARMPKLQAFANESLNFKRTWAQGPLTPMGMGTLMVGRYAANIDWVKWFWKRGRFSNPKHMTPAQLKKAQGRYVFTTIPAFHEGRHLAQRLERAGYSTAGAAYTPGDFFKPGVGFEKGFDHFVDLTRVKWKWPTSQRILDHTLRQIDEMDAPWFAWMHLYDPHENKRKMKKYNVLLKHTDDAFGNLVAALKKRGLYDKTIIGVVSDHGEAFGEHRHGGHGTSLYEEQTRVPMLLRIPGVPGREIEHNAAAIDLAVTFAVAGGANPAKMDGVNLLALAYDDAYPKDRPIFTECMRYMNRNGRRTRDIKAVILGNHKLIFDRMRGTAQLFDLAADPKELKDLRDEKPEVFDELSELLSGFVARGEAAHPLP